MCLQQVDGKYSIKGGRIIKTKTGEPIPLTEPVMLFRGRDRLALPRLRDYRRACIDDGCYADHIAGIDDMIARFEKFAEENSTVMKQPGVTHGL